MILKYFCKFSLTHNIQSFFLPKFSFTTNKMKVDIMCVAVATFKEFIVLKCFAISRTEFDSSFSLLWLQG